MINSGLVEERTGIVVYLFYEVGFNVGVTFFFLLFNLLAWLVYKENNAIFSRSKWRV